MLTYLSSQYAEFYIFGGAAYLCVLALHPRVGLGIAVWVAAIYGITYLPS